VYARRQFVHTALMNVGSYFGMNTRKLWTAVGDRFEFQRVVGALEARIARTGTAWTYVVRCPAGIVAQGTTGSWDEAVQRAERAINPRPGPATPPADRIEAQTGYGGSYAS
jgi:hypothetical protein